MTFNKSTKHIIAGFFLIGILVSLSNVLVYSLGTEIEISQELGGSEDEEVEQIKLEMLANWEDHITRCLMESKISSSHLREYILKRDYREEPSPPPEPRI